MAQVLENGDGASCRRGVAIMIRPSNCFEIGMRGADIDNAEFVFLKCSVCGVYALFDREREMLYTNPDNLRETQLVLGCHSRCVSCLSDGSFEVAPVFDMSSIRQTAWAYAL